MAEYEQNGNLYAPRLAELRRARGWSQEHLAEASGLSPRTIQRAESGAAMSGETLIGLAAVLQVEVSDLTGACEKPAADRPWPRPGAREKWLIWVAAILSLPALMFALSNIGVYELGADWARWLFPFERDGMMFLVLASPFVILGGPFFALALVLPHMVWPVFRKEGSGRIFAGIRFAPSRPGLIVVLSAAGLFLLLTGYAVMENLGHLVAAAG